jgi:hypothetical protein
MKHKLLFGLSLFVVIAIHSQTIQNGGFESWNASSVDNPNFYFQTSNIQAHQLGLPNNCLKVTDPQQGSLAIKLNTVANATDTLFGYFINGDPNSYAGGIPYNQHPVTMTGYYKNNEMVGDTGIAIIIFKQGGIAVSMDIAIFTGTHAAYTPFTVTLSIPPLANPDSIIFGAASSNGLNAIGIAGSMLQLDNIQFTGVTSQPAMLNGSFENWTTSNTSTPQHWATAGDLVFQTTDAHSGTYATQMTTFAYDPQNFSPSYMTNGIFPPNYGPQGGRPYSLMADTLCGWYKYIPQGTDSAIVYIQTSNNTSTVGGAGVALPPASGYTFFSVPFSSFSQPDTLLIVFASSYSNFNFSNVGSILKVDDVYLKSSPAAVEEFSWNVFGAVKLYPNPSNENCWVEFDNNKNVPVVITITDALGKVVSENSVEGTGHQRMHIDTSVLDKGTYLVTLMQNGKRTCKQLFVQ